MSLAKESRTVTGPVRIDGIWEYPLTVFEDWPGHLRHAQIGACSYAELSNMLMQAASAEYGTFVILLHNFELLNREKNRRDPIVVRRFVRLCEFLANRRDLFRARGFIGLPPPKRQERPPLLRSHPWRTGLRLASQVLRRRYG
jgi:hypothetical protein